MVGVDSMTSPEVQAVDEMELMVVTHAQATKPAMNLFVIQRSYKENPAWASLSCVVWKRGKVPGKCLQQMQDFFLT